VTLRLRLTLLYTAILAVALLVFGASLYLIQLQNTLDISKTTLARQVDLFVHGPGRGGEDNHGPRDGYLPGRWTQIRNYSGQITAYTPDLSGTPLPLSAAGLKAVQNGGSWFEIAQVDNEPLLIYSVPIQMQGGTNGIVQVATPIAERQQSLDMLRWILLVGSALVIAGAFAIMWVLGGTALAPIQRIAQTAQAIGAERNFSRRVQYAGPPDEVGQLATTFNTMLTELEMSYRQLEEALQSQKRFVADASHELRTPLTTIRGNIELLKHEPPMDPQERTEVLADTKEEVERLIRLVNQLLVLARADAGQTLDCEPIALKPLLDDVSRQTKLIAKGRTIVCEPCDEVMAMGNRDALKQVFLILIDNAVVHTPPSAMITLSTAEQDGQVQVQVRDTGAGIQPEMLPHIFERFYRGDIARSGRSTGLGLAIAKELVEAQEGTLTVESEVGKGSVFTVSLPSADGQRIKSG